MKATIPQPDLLAAINAVRSVIEKSTIPVLGSFKIDTRDDHIAITATDLNMLATIKTAAEVSDPGEAPVDAGKFYEFARRIPSDRSITLETEDLGAVIKAGRSRAKLATLPVDQFPIPQDPVEGTSFDLAAADVESVLFGPMPAVSSEETRYYLGGVFLHAFENELRGTATDGHKLISKGCALPEGALDLAGVIIPDKPLGVLQRAARGEDVAISVNSRSIEFRTESLVLRSNLIDGTYPDYQRVIPAERDNPVSVDRAEALAVIDRVGSMASGDMRTMVFCHDEGGIEVKTTENVESTADDVITAETNGDFPYIGFDGKKVTSMLQAMSGDRMVFYFNDHGAPHVFADPEHEQDIYVLMPVRVSAG